MATWRTNEPGQSQVITTYGPGALIDLPRHSAIVGGLETWPNGLEEILERRLVHRQALERGLYENRPIVPTRFVRACPRGHVDDLDWVRFVHGDKRCGRWELWLVEHGATGDLGDLVVRCKCGKQRRLYEAAELENNPLGTCTGARPWLGNYAAEDCNQRSRLLIRTASNAYFPQVVSVLALIGFTRLEAVMRDTHGEYETDVERASIAIEPEWFPAVENRSEGVFVQLRAESVTAWLEQPNAPCG